MQMTHFQATMAYYKLGHKETAFQMFLSDPNANDGISFEQFCTSFDKMVIAQAQNEASMRAHAIVAGQAG